MYEHELKVAKRIAYEAGDIMRKYADGDQQRVQKEDDTPLTIADTEINSMVIERLQESFPDDGVIGEEESNTEYGHGRKWFCDPIDGTKAYTWGVPTAVFSLALIVDGQPVMGVVYEPSCDKLYWATKGGGAYRNGDKLSVNSEDLEAGILAVIGNLNLIRYRAPYLDELIERRISLASFSGAAAKCLRVAEGRFVGYIEELLSAHDIAASHLIVEEAGGRVTNFEGEILDYSRPFTEAVVSNGSIHDDLLAVLKRASKS